MAAKKSVEAAFGSLVFRSDKQSDFVVRSAVTVRQGRSHGALFAPIGQARRELQEVFPQSGAVSKLIGESTDRPLAEREKQLVRAAAERWEAVRGSYTEKPWFAGFEERLEHLRQLSE